jgi:hypothetical protein
MTKGTATTTKVRRESVVVMANGVGQAMDAGFLALHSDQTCVVEIVEATALPRAGYYEVAALVLDR